MNFIVAVTKNWGVGIKGGLLLSIPDDMKYFREKTMGKTVLMGEATLRSFPGGKPLKGRESIVLSDDMSLSVEGATVVHSLDEALCELKKHDYDNAFVIGGASVYKLMMPYCRYAYVTKMDVTLEADRYIPSLDDDPDWSIDEQSEEREHNGVKYRFVRYVNSNIKNL